ncbi:MAG: ATP-grasp domain-containing protein [Gammaproteobacteria bacterium]|nr:ATP-grasp domain-containing protein [Gammaproteobacteria bacterium]
MNNKKRLNDQTNEQKVAIIVDGYRTGATLAPRLIKLGFSCIHVQSAPSLDPFFVKTFEPAHYVENFVNTGDFDALANKLKQYPVKFVLPGIDSGIEDADLLSERLGLPCNELKLSAARRDKFKMIDTVAKSGLNTAQQIRSNQLEDIIHFAQELNEWPIILKPLQSAGMDLVFFCYNEGDILTGFHEIMMTKNIFGSENQAVLAQTFLEGTQYIVNTVSYEGKHFLTEMWVLMKKEFKEASPVFDYMKILPYEFEYRETLVQYTFRVLDALGVRYGAAHSEIMLTKKGPALIETGIRCMGAISPDIINEAVGRNQVDLLLKAYAAPENFLAENTNFYSIKKHLFVKFLIASQQGKIEHIQHQDTIKNLKSFYRMSIGVKPGDFLVKTANLKTSPGMIFLLHPDESVVMCDYQTLSQLENDMFVCG